MNSSGDIYLKKPNRNVPKDDIILKPAVPNSDNGNITLSPQKRQRVGYGAKSNRRSKNQQAKKSRNTSESGISLQDQRTDSVLDWNDPNAGGINLEPYEQPTTEEVEQRDSVIAGYSNYVEDVMAGVAGFFQLERDLYIVQGYDTKKSLVKVRLIFRASRTTSLIEWLDISQSGITSKR